MLIVKKKEFRIFALMKMKSNDVIHVKNNIRRLVNYFLLFMEICFLSSVKFNDLFVVCGI